MLPGSLSTCTYELHTTFATAQEPSLTVAQVRINKIKCTAVISLFSMASLPRRYNRQRRRRPGPLLSGETNQHNSVNIDDPHQSSDTLHISNSTNAERCTITTAVDECASSTQGLNNFDRNTGSIGSTWRNNPQLSSSPVLPSVRLRSENLTSPDVYPINGHNSSPKADEPVLFLTLRAQVLTAPAMTLRIMLIMITSSIMDRTHSSQNT